jgi:hypothetical protein
MSVPNTNSTQIQFGAGYIYGLNLGSTYGAAPSLIVPSKFATLQDASVDFTFTVKELNGNLEFPEDLASASKKISGKIATGRVDLGLLNQLVFADLFSTGENAIATNEPHTIAASPTDSVTVTNSATFVQDLGVYYANIFNENNAVQLTPVASSPAQGQYTVAAGVYTFNGADAAQGVLISYEYSLLTGRNLIVTNKIMGYSRPVFQLYLSQPYQGNNDLILYYCRATGLKIPEKREDYTILEIDFMAAANAAGNVAQWCSAV